MGISTLISLWRWYNQTGLKVVHDGFLITRYGLFNTRDQHLPRDDFTGVLMRQYEVKRKNSSTLYQVIELLHRDPELTVPLPSNKRSPTAKWSAAIMNTAPYHQR